MLTTGFILLKLKNPIIKPHRKISKEPTANYSSGFWRHSSPTLYKNNSKTLYLLFDASTYS